MSATQRSPAQVAASKANGSMSVGPKSVETKTASAANSIQHGLASHAVLLPSETSSDYQVNLDAWAATLQPSSPGEVALVARVADCEFRLRRLQHLEEKHQSACLEAMLKETHVSKVLGIAQNANLGMAAMVPTLMDIKNPCSGAHIAKLLSPIASVVEMVEASDLPVAITEPMSKLHADLKAQAAAELIPVEFFTKFADTGNKVIEALDTKIEELQVKVVAERERIADDLLLGDDKELAKFERHRSRINRSLDSELARLKVVRELSQGAVGSSVGPILIELKVIGRKAAPW